MKSIRLAACFGFIATLLTIHMGDESGYLVTKNQPTKIASMEAMWETHEAPAPLSLFALPNDKTRSNEMEVSVPWLFGLMGTRRLKRLRPASSTASVPWDFWKNSARTPQARTCVSSLKKFRLIWVTVCF